MTQVKHFSPYIIQWVEFRPVTGKASKADMNKLKVFTFKQNGYQHFPNREKALAFLQSMAGIKLQNRYECRIFSDKQWELKKGDVVPFTTKQLNEVFYLG